MSACSWAQTFLGSEMGGLSISDRPLFNPSWHILRVPFGFHLYTSPPISFNPRTVRKRHLGK